MARVGLENCRDYRDAIIDEGDLSSGSILNHVKLLKALFTYAFDNEHITSNPMARIKYSAGHRNERDDFTPEERKPILTLAREAEPHVHWVNWLCSFLGTRTSEVADASTLDIENIDGIWVMSIHRKHRSRDQRLKTKVSKRKLALHGALLDEGFLDYWRSLPLGGRYSPTCRSTPTASEPVR
jgi:site-specific recombinase XerD